DGACVLRGGRHDRWDLEVRGGFLGAARLLLGVEEHPGGHQMLRLRWWPDVPARGPLLTLAFALLARSALHDQAWVAMAALRPGDPAAAAGVAGAAAGHTGPESGRRARDRHRVTARRHGVGPAAGPRDHAGADLHRGAARARLPLPARPTSAAAVALLSRLARHRRLRLPHPVRRLRAPEHFGRRGDSVR